jgi:hypothetical protein
MMPPTGSPEAPADPTAQSTNYLKWILIGCGSLIIISFGIGVLAVGILYLRRPASSRSSPPSNSPSYKSPSSSRDTVKLVSDHSIETVAKTWNSCTAFAPEDWTIEGNEQRVGIGVDLGSSDRSMFASYGIAGVPVAQLNGQDVYGTETPETLLKNMFESTGSSNFVFDEGSTTIPTGDTLRYWHAYYEGKPLRGFALYRTFDSGLPGTYIIAYRAGATEVNKWAENKNLVYDVAASIRCTKHLFPAQESATAGREPKGSSKDQIEERLSTQQEETTMGFRNVYSPSTGQHWEASFDDYNPTGPDGPGYYRRVGNSYEKLNEGFPPN